MTTPQSKTASKITEFKIGDIVRDIKFGGIYEVLSIGARGLQIGCNSWLHLANAKKANCRRSPDGEHEGYWINRARDNFRCYHCGFQFFRSEMEQPTPKNRIETWKGGAR